ncbi:MAG TPA: ACT domain-containing protein [Gammaproteobacteria bacterium]|nr:ACT domain-containing protein [Gammaproteobacteria bacterium]
MPTELNSYLVITALGPDQVNMVNQLTHSITNYGGNILNTRMTTLGNEFGIMLLVEGSWNAVAKIEASLPGIEQRLGITTNVRRTTPKQKQKKTMPYLVHAVTNDREGILNDLAQFFAQQDIKIEDVRAHTYMAQTGTRMSSMSININIAVNTHLPTLREKFMSYCDELNLDAGLEPLHD